jgi:hypothetical protein
MTALGRTFPFRIETTARSFPATATTEPSFEVENLRREPEPLPQQRLRGQQRDMVAGDAIDFSDLPPISLSPTLACNLSEKHKKRDTLPH